MSKSSDYSLREREKWLRMWPPLSKCLERNRYSFLIDVAFHVELESLPDDLLAKELVPKLGLVATPSTIIDNDTWTVSVRFVDMDRIQREFAGRDLRITSPLFPFHIAGEFDPAKGITFAISGRPVPGDESYVHEVDFAAGAIWYCDAEDAVRKKARHIKRHVLSAVDQLPAMAPGIVHVALESHDGGVVEEKRFERTKEALADIWTKGKLLAFIYMHVFDPRVLPNKAWDIGESSTWFSAFDVNEEPLKNPQVVVPG